MSLCSDMAQTEGALADFTRYCVAVVGKVVPITDSGVSVEEMGLIMNLNFHQKGYKPSAKTQYDLPGEATISIRV